MLFYSLVVLFAGLCHAFRMSNIRQSHFTSTSTALRMAGESQDPLLLRAARGEEVERVPVWMMRQAGRHMKVYRDLCKTHKTFRDRSENVDVSTEIRYILSSYICKYSYVCSFIMFLPYMPMLLSVCNRGARTALTGASSSRTS